MLLLEELGVMELSTGAPLPVVPATTPTPTPRPPLLFARLEEGVDEPCWLVAFR